MVLIVVVHAVLLAPLVVAVLGAFGERAENEGYAPALRSWSRLVLSSEDAGVAALTLNRPEKRDALSLELRGGLAAAARPSRRGRAASSSPARAAPSAREWIRSSAGTPRTASGSSPRARGCSPPGPLPGARRRRAEQPGHRRRLRPRPPVRHPGGGGRRPDGLPRGRAAHPAELRRRPGRPPPALARELCLTGRVLTRAEALAGGWSPRSCPRPGCPRAAAVAAGMAAPRTAAREVKRRAMLKGEATWGRLLEEELAALKAAVLREGGRRRPRRVGHLRPRRGVPVRARSSTPPAAWDDAGGGGAVAAAELARLGADVEFFTALGDDDPVGARRGRGRLR